jgi:hypothetical protein
MKFRESTFKFTFPLHFDGILPSPGVEIEKAAIIREK